jgi:hypothetical protein
MISKTFWNPSKIQRKYRRTKRYYIKLKICKDCSDNKYHSCPNNCGQLLSNESIHKKGGHSKKKCNSEYVKSHTHSDKDKEINKLQKELIKLRLKYQKNAYIYEFTENQLRNENENLRNENEKLRNETISPELKAYIKELQEEVIQLRILHCKYCHPCLDSVKHKYKCKNCKICKNCNKVTIVTFDDEKTNI